MTRISVPLFLLVTLAGQLPITLTVTADHPWTATGLKVQKGDRLVFHATGEVRWGSGPTDTAGPEGYNGTAKKLGKAGLIGRIGYTGKAFAIGRCTEPLTMSKSGPLFLGINDFVFHDNEGSFTVRVDAAPDK